MYLALFFLALFGTGPIVCETSSLICGRFLSFFFVFHFFVFHFFVFLSKDLAVRTACLNLPLACGYFDELVVCTKPYLVANSRKESVLYWGTL